MKRIWILIFCLTLLIPLSGFAKAPDVATYPPSALGGQYGVFFTGPGREPEAVTASHPMPVTVIGSFTSSGGGGAITLPVASSTANATQALPIALGASDQSAIQRLFTAIVMGDGVNGNNMLPFAQYLWNGASWDRAKAPQYDASGSIRVNIASSAITFASSVAVDGESRTLVNLASNSTVMIASIAVGIVLQDVRSIASNANTVFADITSGTAAPFWCMIRNTGTQKIHLDSVAPGDTTDYIGAGEQWGPVFFGTNVPNYKFRANSAGTSTWALTLTK